MKEVIPLDEFFTGAQIPEPAKDIVQPDVVPLDAFFQKPDDRGFFEKTIDSVVDSYQGNAEFDYPEFQEYSGDNALKIATAFSFEPSIEGKAAIIKEYLPEASFGRDKNDNIYTVVGDKRFYINKPGMSSQDLLDLGSEIAKFAPAARGAHVATKGTSAITRLGAQFAGGAATSLASDEIAQALGSDQDTEVIDAVLAGGFVAGGEALGPLLGSVFRKIYRGDKLTNAEKGELITRGINPDEISPEMVKEVARRKAGYTPEETGRIAEAMALPEPILQTTGQITQNPAIQSLEETAKRTTMFGDDIQSKALDFARKQDEAIEANIQKISAKFSGEAQSATEIGERIQLKLSDLRALRGEAVSNSYEQAKQGKAFVPGSALDDLTKRFQASFEEMQLDVPSTPEVKRVLDRIASYRNSFGNSNVNLRVQSLEGIRKYINTNVISNAAPGSKEALAGGKMTRAVDSLIDDYIDAGLLSGDKEAVRQLRKARSLSREFKRDFDSKDIVSLLTKKQGFGSDARLVIDADDAINAIFSKNSITRKGITGDVQKLKELLPKEDFSALKQAGFLRLIGDQKGKQFSAASFSKSLNEALKNNPALMKELYSSEEIKIMQRFANVAKRVKVPVPGGSNPSGTAAAVINGLQRYFGNAGYFAGSFLSGGAKRINAGKINDSLQMRAPINREAPSGLKGSVAGGVYKDVTAE